MIFKNIMKLQFLLCLIISTFFYIDIRLHYIVSAYKFTCIGTRHNVNLILMNFYAETVNYAGGCDNSIN